jgi:CBS domain-containing protein
MDPIMIEELDVLREPICVKPQMGLMDLLRTFQEEHCHLAVVSLDPVQTLAAMKLQERSQHHEALIVGIITMEDLLEKMIQSEIMDETDGIHSKIFYSSKRAGAPTIFYHNLRRKPEKTISRKERIPSMNGEDTSPNNNNNHIKNNSPLKKRRKTTTYLTENPVIDPISRRFYEPVVTTNETSISSAEGRNSIIYIQENMQPIVDTLPSRSAEHHLLGEYGSLMETTTTTTTTQHTTATNNIRDYADYYHEEEYQEEEDTFVIPREMTESTSLLSKEPNRSSLSLTSSTTSKLFPSTTTASSTNIESSHKKQLSSEISATKKLEIGDWEYLV